MKHEKVLGILILSDFVLGVLSVVTAFALEPFLPSSLRAYLAAEGTTAVGLSESLLTGLWVAVVGGTVLAWAGLLNLIRVARPLYLGSWVGYMVYLLLSGPVVSTAVGYVVQMLMTLVGGAIVGVVYFSELRTRFRRFRGLMGASMDEAA